jgi:hypothetical protein
LRDAWLIVVIVASSCAAIARPAASSEAEAMRRPEASRAKILFKAELEDEIPDIAVDES